MKTVLLVILGIVLFLAAAVFIFGLFAAVRIARAATRLTWEKLREAEILVRQPEVSDEARALYAQAVLAAENIPDVSFTNVKSVFRAIALALEPLMKAVDRAYQDLTAKGEADINSASTYVQSVAAQVASEFALEANMIMATTRLEQARALVLRKRFKDASDMVKEAIAEADAEYRRIRDLKAFTAAALPSPPQDPGKPE